jgi:mannose-1-phosphate guanylyltransferase
MTLFAMVLAAGRGERMRPLSGVLPKPALPLPEQPVIASGIRLAGAAGATRVVVNTWHLADLMQDRLGEIEHPAQTIAISRETELMGTAGGIALARDRGLLGDRGPVLVINGDGLLNLDLEPLLRRLETSDDLISLALLPHLDRRRWSSISLDQKGLVAKIRRPGAAAAGETSFLYPGVMLITREALCRLPSGPGDTPARLWGPALTEGRLGGVVVNGRWREIGTPSDYLEAVLERVSPTTVRHPSAAVDVSARLRSSLIGRNAVVEAGAVVESSVVAEGATVRSNAHVQRSVLLGPTSTEPRESMAGEFRTEPICR